MCAKLLLQYIGPAVYTLVSTLVAPKNVKNLQYDEIVSILDSHFCPKKNVLVEQHTFLCEIQNENQTMASLLPYYRNGQLIVRWYVNAASPWQIFFFERNVLEDCGIVIYESSYFKSRNQRLWKLHKKH